MPIHTWMFQSFSFIFFFFLSRSIMQVRLFWYYFFIIALFLIFPQLNNVLQCRWSVIWGIFSHKLLLVLDGIDTKKWQIIHSRVKAIIQLDVKERKFISHKTKTNFLSTENCQQKNTKELKSVYENFMLKSLFMYLVLKNQNE